MPATFDFLRNRLVGCGVALAMSTVFASVPAIGADVVLHSFKGGADGKLPEGGLIQDTSGNLYGTTEFGGGSPDNCDNFGNNSCGTVFALAPDGSETVLHTFTGVCDGADPVAGLVADSVGNLYGTTAGGGDCKNDGNYGTVFKLAPDGTETVLYGFNGGKDGYDPVGALIVDKNGNLFGTTAVGGGFTGCGNPNGCGTVFEVTPSGKETILHSFLGGNDGGIPAAGLIMDSSGNLYGTTQEGGSGGSGTVFEIAASGTETILHAFLGGADGALPSASLISDSSGNLYGTTEIGGSSDDGTVFKVAADGTESVLYSFKGGTDGNSPVANLIIDNAGNLYGTTYNGGGAGCKKSGCGTVFKLAPDGKETVLYAFKKRALGQNPAASLLLGANNTLYGTTTAGGKKRDGLVFSLKTK